jgi:thioredoxin-like negative regulator of GroEL
MLLEAASPSPASYVAEPPEDYRPQTVFPVLTAENLRGTLISEVRPAAVLCGAAWAAPYRVQHCDLAALARATGDRFAFFTLDVLREEELAAWIRVRVLPTTLIFRGGQVAARFEGHTGRREIQSALTAAAFPARR